MFFRWQLACGVCCVFKEKSEMHLDLLSFFPFILDIMFVGRTSRGVTHEEGHTGFLIHLLSAMRALMFSREKDSAIPFPRRP